MSNRENRPNIPDIELDMHGKPKHWLVREKTIQKLKNWGYCILAILLLCDFFVHAHEYFGIDGTFGFNSWYGLLSCIAMILVAKALAHILKREDTYYDVE